MHELFEMEERMYRMYCLAQTMSALEDAMINGDEEVSGEAWMIPVSEMLRLSNEMSALIDTCIERERESKQQPVMAR